MKIHKPNQEFKIVNMLDKEIWRQFVDRHPEGNIFHTPEMFSVFSQTKQHHPKLWAAVDNNEYPLALLLPVEITLKNGLLHRLTTRAISYGSTLSAPGSRGDEALKKLLEIYTEESKDNILFTELRCITDPSNQHALLTGSGFEYEGHLNYLIKLDRSPEAVLQGIGKRTRKQIRRGLRKGEVVIEEAEREEQVVACYSLLQKTYAAAQVPLADRSLFEAAFRLLHPKGMAKFLLARVDNDYAAGSIELIYKDRIYGWYGGMDRAFSNLSPNELLMWHILKWGAEHSHKIYDFGGAGKPDEDYGVRDFKAKFGGDLVNYGRFTYIHSPRLLKLSKFGYSIYRHIL